MNTLGRPGPMRLLGRLGVVSATAILLVQTAGAEEAAERKQPTWAFSTSAMAYFLPQERDLVVPAVKADRG
jgi:hypothetical protein